MYAIGVDIGGTKIASAIFNNEGKIIHSEKTAVLDFTGEEVGKLITKTINALMDYALNNKMKIYGLGVSVPGIYYHKSGHVWAPNIGGWDKYPLLEQLKSLPSLSGVNINIDSDRACYILGETWQGSAKGSENAIFIAVGTGIGAGILIDGKILRGVGDVAGAIGWMGLEQTFDEKFKSCGHFEYYASGEGLARFAQDLVKKYIDYTGTLSKIHPENITSYDVFDAFEKNDPLAIEIIEKAIKMWGMVIANLISIFNPEKIILGGGLFGPAAQFIDKIKAETFKWAQPISAQQVVIGISSIGSDAGLIGAGKLAFVEE